MGQVLVRDRGHGLVRTWSGSRSIRLCCGRPCAIGTWPTTLTPCPSGQPPCRVLGALRRRRRAVAPYHQWAPRAGELLDVPLIGAVGQQVVGPGVAEHVRMHRRQADGIASSDQHLRDPAAGDPPAAAVTGPDRQEQRGRACRGMTLPGSQVPAQSQRGLAADRYEPLVAALRTAQPGCRECAGRRHRHRYPPARRGDSRCRSGHAGSRRRGGRRTSSRARSDGGAWPGPRRG